MPSKNPKKTKMNLQASLKVSRKRGSKRVKEPAIVYPTLLSSTGSYFFVDSIKKLNDRQKAAVREIGFGHVLSLDIEELPPTLAYWAVKHFKPACCALILQDGERLHIEEEDVYRVFGFPKGTQTIQRNEKNESCKLLNEWYSFFPIKGRVSSKILARVMLAQEDGGLWFKRHFLVLLTASLIENSSNGYITPNIMSYFENMDRVRDLDWGGYLLRCLIDSKIAWRVNETRPFCGPSLFLTTFYVDRVMLYAKKVERCYPICRNWDYAKLKDREADEISAGGFGFGSPLDPIDREKLDVDLYAYKILMKSGRLANMMVELIQIIQNAPEPKDAVESMKLRKAIEMVHKVIGCDIRINNSTVNNAPSQQFSDKDSFWAREDVRAAMRDIDNAVVMRNEYFSKISRREHPTPWYAAQAE